MSSDELFDGLHALTEAARSRCRLKSRDEGRARENPTEAGVGAPFIVASVESDTPKISSAPTASQLNSSINKDRPTPLDLLAATRTAPQFLQNKNNYANFEKIPFQAARPDAMLVSPPQQISRASAFTSPVDSGGVHKSISDMGPPLLLPPPSDDKKKPPKEQDNFHLLDRAPRSPGKPIKPTAGPKPYFVVELMRLLTNDRHKDIFHFLPDQKHFVILDTHKFAKDILPVYFGVKSYTSFANKLMRWGFECLREKLRGTRRVVNVFYHPQFARDKWDDCREIECLGALAKRPTRQDPLPGSLIANSERSLISINAGGSANALVHTSDPRVRTVKPILSRPCGFSTTSNIPTANPVVFMPPQQATTSSIAIPRGIPTRGDPVPFTTTTTPTSNIDQQQFSILRREVEQLRQLNEMRKARIAALRMKREELMQQQQQQQQQQPSLVRLPDRNLYALGPFDPMVTGRTDSTAAATERMLATRRFGE